MRRFCSVTLPALILFGCAAMQGGHAERVRLAREATYDLPRSEVMKGVLTVLTRKYSIERQVESRGYFETAWVEDARGDVRYRVRIIAEVSGERPYRVTFRAEALRAEVFGGMLSGWSQTSGKQYEDELYAALYDLLAPAAEETPPESGA